MKKTIVITGAGGGIGMACGEVLKDYKLVMTDYSESIVKKVTDQFTQQGFDVVGIACDISKKSDVEKLKKFVLKQGDFGGLVHTAGVSGSGQNPKIVFDIDLVGTDIIIDAFYEVAKEGSALILFSSIMGHMVPPNIEYDEALRNPQQEGSYKTVLSFVDNNADIMYNFVKRGVQLLCKDNAFRYGENGARIISISPGVIMTPMAIKASEEHPEEMNRMKKITPLRRNGTPEDIADVVQFLLSNKAKFITGSDILVDGGILPGLMKST
ncbi:7-alpha-hydroxysteroid dehydrogenase [Arenibacter antarcticus]|uniref:SDR family oxidoreductase n=1 Tax=Arenibacter antarcticus TaxID=2040469 RepID=A0ABW5VGD9_9FLAO|nr:SDR family oxidoreductase [Arenibacter sp. H213]MCM4167200.1 short-chain dehydrogenase [Arenibacter sp. H213]